MLLHTCIANRTIVKGSQNQAAARENLDADSPALRVHMTTVKSVSSNVASGNIEGTEQTDDGSSNARCLVGGECPYLHRIPCETKRIDCELMPRHAIDNNIAAISDYRYVAHPS